MALTIEPGLYIPDDPAFGALRGIGVRIEDDVAITGGGVRVGVQWGWEGGSWQLCLPISTFTAHPISWLSTVHRCNSLPASLSRPCTP